MQEFYNSLDKRNITVGDFMKSHYFYFNYFLTKEIKNMKLCDYLKFLNKKKQQKAKRQRQKNRKIKQILNKFFYSDLTNIIFAYYKKMIKKTSIQYK